MIVNQCRRHNDKEPIGFPVKQQHKPFRLVDDLFQNRATRDERLGHMMKSADGTLCMKTDYVREGSGEDQSGTGKERPLKQEKICLTRSSKIFPATTTVP